MNAVTNYLKANVAKAPLGLVLVLLFILEIFTAGYFGLKTPPVIMDGALQLTEIDGPTITTGAAMTSLAMELCADAPEFPAVWFLALVLFVLVLVGNFVWALKTKDTIEWVPEACYVFIILCTWLIVDPCYTASWFPVTLLKLSLIILAIYLYLLEKKTSPTLF